MLSCSSSPSFSSIVKEFEQFFSLNISVQVRPFAMHAHRLLSQDVAKPQDKSLKMLSGAGKIVIQSVGN